MIIHRSIKGLFGLILITVLLTTAYTMHQTIIPTQVHIVLDLSQSMTTADSTSRDDSAILQQRSATAESIITNLLSSHPTTQRSLHFITKDTIVQGSPLTTDTEFIMHMIKTTKPRTIPSKNTESSCTSLMTSLGQTYPGSTIIFLTDGGIPCSMATSQANKKIVIGLGTRQGDYFSLPDGSRSPIISTRNDKTISNYGANTIIFDKESSILSTSQGGQPGYMTRIIFLAILAFLW